MSKHATHQKMVSDSWPRKWEPHTYQKRAVKWLVEHACAGLFLEPGLGKTTIVLGALKILASKNLLGKVFIIAPLRVCEFVWPYEIEKWQDFNHFRISVIHGTEKMRDTALNTDADIYAINPEGLDWLLTERRAQFGKLGLDTLVVDESSKFKHSNTKRFKLIKKELNMFSRRWILTGSPAANGLMDLFSQIYIMDQGARLGKYITTFRYNYFIQTGFGGYKWLPKPGANKIIYNKLGDAVISMRAEDVLQMPTLVETNIRIRLPEHARKVYDDLETKLFALLDEYRVDAVNTAVALIKCKQVANGALYLDAVQGTYAELHDAKIDAIRDLVESLAGAPILIGYEFAHDLDRLKKALGDPPHLGAGVDKKKSAQIIAMWNAGSIPVLLGNPASLGHGLNMQSACHHVAFFSMLWDWDLVYQFVRRVWRQGQRNRVIVHRFIAADTVDEAILAAQVSKAKTESDLMDALRLYKSGAIKCKL